MLSWAFLVFGVDVAFARAQVRKGAVRLLESEAKSARQARASRLPDVRLFEALAPVFLIAGLAAGWGLIDRSKAHHAAS